MKQLDWQHIYCTRQCVPDTKNKQLMTQSPRHQYKSKPKLLAAKVGQLQLSPPV